MFSSYPLTRACRIFTSFFALLLIQLISNSSHVLATSNDDGCVRQMANTTSCANKTFVLYLIDKYDNTYHLSGTSSSYNWLENPDGTVRITGTGFTHSSLSGDVFTVDIQLSSPTSTAPSGSPKSNYCGSLGSTNDWVYYETVSGTVTSKIHGVFSVSKRGTAFQLGTNANTNQLGYGASGWLTLTGGDGYFDAGDINTMLTSSCTPRVIECERDVQNTVGCANTPYVLWFKNKYNTAFHLDGDTSTYRWLQYENGDVRLIASGLEHSSLTNDTYDIDILFGGLTSSAPSGSPKGSNCGTVGSTNDWSYFTTTNGTVRSSKHGTFIVTRQGPAFQQGKDANITQLGYGASGWLYISGGDGYLSSGDINVMLSESCDEPSDDPVVVCERDVKNTVGCANTPYILWFKNKYGNAFHLDGDTSTYKWVEYDNGNVRLTASDLEHPSLSNDTYDIDILFEGATTSAPSGSPKSSNCGTVNSYSDWTYFTSTSGTITSSQHGTFTVSRKGPAFQQGNDANITQLGYGGSGWLYISGGDGYLTTGDINVILSEDCEGGNSECDGTSHSFDPCIVAIGKGSTGRASTTINITTPVSEIDEILVEGIYKGGQPTYGNFYNGTSTVSWTSSDAQTLNNVSGTSNKGFYQATLPAASSVTMNVGNYRSNMHGFVAYVKLKDEYCSDNFTSLSDDRYYIYHNTKTTTLTLPNTANAKNITAVLPIAEMNNDSRVAVFTLAAGSQSKTVTINTYDLGQSMTILTLSLDEVPGNVTSATLTFHSPSDNGDSYVTGNASINWYLPCQSEATNLISGYTFFDRNRDTIKSDGEESEQGITVYLYSDTNHDGILDSGEDTPIDSLITDGDGYYEFEVPYSCTTKNVSGIEYSYGINNPANAVGNPGSNFAGFTMDTDNFIVELDGIVPVGGTYEIFLKAIESGAYAIISESTDGVNFYHNTDIALTSSSKLGYTITASRNTKYIKFDKHDIDGISGYNVNGSTYTNVYDYGIYGVEFCSGANSFIVQTNEETHPEGSSMTTDNIETASFNSGGNHDQNNNFGINGPVFIDGYVYKDPNSNGVKEGGEPGQIGVTVYLYYDLNLNGQVDPGEPAIDSAISSSSGYYSFERQFGCMNQFIKGVSYTSGINNPSNAIGMPDNNYAGFTMDTDNYVVELDGTIPSGAKYDAYFGAIESGAIAIISESTDGINFYHNTNVPITTSGSKAYEITASRDVRFIKFDKHDIDPISGLIIFGSTNTNVYDYAIYGIQFCNAQINAYAVNTKLSEYPSGTSLTTDNIESALFTSYNQEDLNNNFGFNVEGGVGEFCGSLKITVNHNKVEGDDDLSDFPVYFDITNAALKSATNGGSVASEYGYDVQLTNQVGARLNIELIDYEPTTGRIKFWGSVDVLKAGSNTILYLRHGNIDSSTTDPSSTNTWSEDYKSVYHFEDLNDATGNNNTATNYGASTANGKLSGSYKFNGSSDYMRVPYSTSLNIGGKNLTMSAWVKIDPSPSDDAPFAAKGPSVNQEAYMFGVDGGTSPVKINSRVTTNTGHYRHDAGSLPTSEWALVHFVYDGLATSNQKRVYVNGNLAYTAGAAGDIKQGNHDMFIGKRLYADNRYLDGKLDELRISCSSSSAGWVGTEYNNQHNPSTFYSLSTGTECTDPVPVTWLEFKAQKVSESSNQLTWSTASEINNDYFEIQRRWENETEFKVIGKVQGSGTSSSISLYSYPDFISEKNGDVVYYRLRQVDFDGTIDYSSIRLIDYKSALSGGGLVNRVYPVPAATEVTLELNNRIKERDISSIRIMDLTGRELSNDAMYTHNGNLVNVNISNMPTGIYYIEISNVLETQTLRFIVDRSNY